MKRTSPTNLILAKAALIVAIGLAMNTAGAALTDLASEPLSKSGSSVVKPNLMLLLDDSGSMDWNYMPDSVNDDPACKTTGSSLTPCNDADPPRYSAQFNGIYYNPVITYTPAVKYDGTSYPSYTTWTAVPNDGFGIQSTGTTDLTLNYADNVWCNTSSPSTSDRSPPFSGACRHPIQGGVWTYPNGTYNRQFSVAGTNPPYYYTISSLAWCSSANAGGFGTGTCQAKKTATFQYPKYGTGSDGFTRTEIVPGTTTYPRAASTHRLFRRSRANRLHLRTGDDQLRQLVCLLSHPHADDENGRGSVIQAGHRQLPRRLHHHQSRQPGRRRRNFSPSRISPPVRVARSKPGTQSSTHRIRTRERHCGKPCPGSDATMAT